MYQSKLQKLLLLSVLSIIYSLPSYAAITEFSVQGVVYYDDPKERVVIVQNKNETTQQRYHIGDVIDKDYLIVAVEEKHIVVSKNGELTKLILKTGENLAVDKEEAKQLLQDFTKQTSGVAAVNSGGAAKSPAGYSISADGRPMTKEEFEIKKAALTGFMGKDQADLQMFYEAPDLSPYKTEVEINALIKRVEESWQ